MIDGTPPSRVIKNAVPEFERVLARAVWKIDRTVVFDELQVEQVETPSGQQLVRVVFRRDGKEQGGYLMVLHR